MSRRIGITSTIPHEIIVAAGAVPVDLNNVFVAAPRPGAMVELAEAEGFPAGVCAWIKGIYGAVRAGHVDTVVTVVNGDCSNTQALGEVLRHRGVETIPFSYPLEPEPRAVAHALRDFAQRLGVDLAEAEAVREAWRPVRAHLRELDRLAWEEGRLTSAELHHWLVSASDFGGDAADFDRRLTAFLDEARQRPPRKVSQRLALLGVPPIYNDLFAAVDERDAAVVFCEVPRQFAMPYDSPDLVDQFCRYTYPYDLNHRLADLRVEIDRRRVDGVVHYLQAFCHRQIEHIVIKDELDVPVLPLEGDRPGELPGQALTRLDAFLELLA